MNEINTDLQNQVSREIRFWQQKLILGVLRTLALVGSPLTALLLYEAFQARLWGTFALYGGACALLLFVTWRRIPYNVQVVSLLIIFYGLAVTDLIEYGRSGNGALALLPFPLLVTIFFNRRRGLFALLLAVLTMAVTSWAFVTARIVVAVQQQTTTDVAIDWIGSTLVITVVGAMLAILPSFLMQRLTLTLAQSRALVQELEQRMVIEQEQRERLQLANREIKERAASEQKQREQLQRVISQVREAINDLSLTAHGILSSTTQQAAGASQQSAAISQTTATVDELKIIAEQSVSRAQQVAGASQRTVDVSHSGLQAVQNTIESMARIKNRVEGVAENILALAEQTQQIGEIITTVSDIAAQSNMLALNASVESARAGEYGKGFAVVAVEMRNLAEQSKQAAGQVKAILADIQRATNATVMAIEQGSQGVDEGVLLATQAQQAIEQLAAVIDESAQAATQMVAGGQQQALGVEQVVLAMRDIDKVTTQSLDGTRQAEMYARELNVMARNLAEVVE